MPKKPGEYQVMFHKVAVEMTIRGPLHATTPQNPEGVGYMMARMPSESVLAARQAMGEPITPVDQLTKEVLEQVGATGGEDGAPQKEEVNQRAVFRRDEKGVFIHDNYFLGHLRECGKSISRAVGFWGLEAFISQTASFRPERLYLPQEVKVEVWPFRADIYRKGPVSFFREAEYVENPPLSLNLFLLTDPRWNASLLKALFDWGANHGIGGGRARGMGRYTFTLSPWGKQVTADEVWKA